VIYRFGDHTLDTESLRLTADGEEIAVEPQVFSLLQYLIEHRDRVVSKDEIIEHVWDGRIVSDGTLTSRINSVRRAVRDDGKSQAVIKTFPRRGIRFVAAITEDIVPEATSPLPDKPSIAVLPFDNLSDDPQQEYFSDGMAEDLITDISNISGLFVIARNSSFAFKGQAVDVKEIAEKLGVNHILEGSVRKMGDRLRINAQLIDAASGGPIWAQRYDGDMENIFDFQDDIREQIVSALKVSLSPTDMALTERKPTNSVEAYDLYLRGRANLNRLSRETVLEAMDHLENAIKIDPNYGDAYGYLSFCLFIGYAFLFPGFDDGLERAYEMSIKGVDVDGASSIALGRLGWNQTFMCQHNQSIASFEKAIDLAPNDAELHATYGQCLNYFGDPERGLEMIEKGLRMEPLHFPGWEFQLAHSYLLLGRFDEALAKYRFVIERLPKFVPCYLFMASTCIEMGRLNEAREAVRTALEIMPRYTIKEVERIWTIYRNADKSQRFIDNLRKAGLPEG
jgi:TolB-like protein